MDDAVAVALMLGRPPRGTWNVARRCACGLPQVIETTGPLEDGTPFPTLWWLTCRRLCKEVGRLEAGGWMASFNERLAAEPELAAALAQATRVYVARRDGATGDPTTGLLLPSGGIRGAEPPEQRHPGGGGTPGGRIKCLHAHTAHQLVTGDNPAGAGVLMALAWADPETPCVAPGG